MTADETSVRSRTDAVVNLDAEDIESQVFEICKILLGGTGGDAAWNALKREDAKIVHISRGLTNVLYCVGPTDAENSKAFRVLFRCFGEAGSVVCDREKENIIFAQLSHLGIGPRLHGLFGNGRIEGWLEGRRPLEPLEMTQTAPTDFVRMTAERTAEFHSKGPVSKDDDVWDQLRTWASLAQAVAFPSDSAKASKLAEIDPFPRLLHEIDAIEELLPSSRNASGVSLVSCATKGANRRARELLHERRFCHLDLLAGNIMHSAMQADVRFIDFEYSFCSCIGLDIANHFNAVPESCLIVDGSFDPEKYYPSRDLQVAWLKAYFKARGISVSEEEIQEMPSLILDFALLAELRWVIWAIVQAGASPVDFDYLDYCQLRLEKGYAKYMEWRSSRRYATIG